MKLDSVLLTKKTRCTVCRTKVTEGKVMQVHRNLKGKIRAYTCKPECNNLYVANPGNWTGNADTKLD